MDAIQEAGLHKDSLVDRSDVFSQVQEMEKNEAEKRMEQKMRHRCVQSGSVGNACHINSMRREKKKITDKAVLIAWV